MEETQVAETSEPRVKSERAALAIGVAGWILPGLGHAFQKMWGRAIGCFLTVGVLVIIGAGMRGNLFTADGGDAFASLGYVADLGTGAFYFLAKSLEIDGPRCMLMKRRGDGRLEGAARMTLQLSHFQAMLLFALAISIAFGFLSRRPALERLKYIGWSLLMFLLIGIGIGWVMYPFSR
jgi:hypothetical protein